METSLYEPVKAFLETAGFSVKGEIGGCDLVGMIEGEPPLLVICELKMSFNLELVLQAVDRAALADEIWIAARISAKGRGREADTRFRNLCRRLGIGMLGVADTGHVSVIVSAAAPMPRLNAKRRTRLVREHRNRRGDTARGGSTRTPIMTAYRQRALLCAEALKRGAIRPRDMKHLAADAGRILLDNVYGWFDRTGTGLYALNADGQAALERWPQDALFPPVDSVPDTEANGAT